MISKNPKVSIIIPVYNGADYLREAIDSALSQTYENLEIIVVNDGSTDSTNKICKSYGNKIRYFSKKNGGVSTALNKGIAEMTGEYFSWLSHDDIYYPNKIEEQIKNLSNISKNEKVILYSDFEIINEKGESIVMVHNDHDMLNKKPEYALLRTCLNGITLLIPKKAFDECGVFDTNLRCTQDYTKWKEMMEKYKFIHTSDILTKTRMHDKQGSRINPSCEEEGNNLWINMMESLSWKDKIRLEGSAYKFYEEMVNFMNESCPYPKAIQYASYKMKTISMIDKFLYLKNRYGFFGVCRNLLSKIWKR